MPTGKLASAFNDPITSDNASQYSNLFRGKAGGNIQSSADMNIMKPLEFTVLKGHTVDRERAV